MFDWCTRKNVMILFLIYVQDTLNGFIKNSNDQVEEVCAKIRDDPQLKNGYNAVGFSQGSQFL